MAETSAMTETAVTTDAAEPLDPSKTMPLKPLSPARESTEAWLHAFATALAARDVDVAAALFADPSYWRDLVAFTWNIVTVESPPGVRALLRAQLPHVEPTAFRIADEPADEDGVFAAWFTFETRVGRGRGHLRLRDGAAWTLLTALEELKGFEEPLSARRPRGVAHGARADRRTWSEGRAQEERELGDSRQPYALVVGGGQGGIALAARLRQLDVPTIVVDKNPKPGDEWRRRYKSLCLHDPVWYDHMPYMPFPPNWPVFSPKDKIGDWLEMYAKVMELVYWGSTAAKSAKYDDAKGEWTVVVDRDGQEVTLRPRQLVLATGVSGKPYVPDFPGADRFRGEQHHSSAHPGPDAYRGQKAVVIGSNNSAHDICAALHEHGVHVTMVQRSSTCIVRSDSLIAALAGLYSEEAAARGVSTYTADMTIASIPYRLLAPFQKPLYDAMRAKDAEYYAALARAGFRLDWGPDGSGLFVKYHRCGSGYYIDVGAASLVADGTIALKSGQVAGLDETGVAMVDGSHVPADLVVYATGYGSMNGWAAELISEEVADKVGKVWGYGSDTPKDPGPWEGELRNMWKPTQQAGLWFHGGNLHQSRHFSLYLALQIKARMEGLDAKVYGLQEVHHKE